MLITYDYLRLISSKNVINQQYWTVFKENVKIVAYGYTFPNVRGQSFLVNTEIMNNHDYVRL